MVYTATVLFADTEYTDSKTEILPILGAPKLGSETVTDTNAPSVELEILQNVSAELEVQSLGELTPDDLMLWAYIGESLMAEDREDIDAALTWAVDYSDKMIAEIRAGDAFLVHIAPEDTAAYAESDAMLIIIHSGHAEGEAVVENNVEPTCTEEGSHDVVIYCTVCGEELSRESKTIEKIEHTPGEAVRENEHPATCTTEGSYDEVIYCTVCGEELSRESKTIEKIAHTPGEAVRENEVPATCTTEGSYDEVIYCTVCGEELSREAKTVAALGHAWGEWTVTAEPTCTEKGEETRACSRCDATETRDVEALGHDYGETLTKAPEPIYDSGEFAGYKAGYQYQICANCSEQRIGDSIRYKPTISVWFDKIEGDGDTIKGRIELFCSDANLIVSYEDEEYRLYEGDDFTYEIISCSASLTDLAAIHAGEEISVSIKFVPKDSVNYEAVSGSYSFTILEDEAITEPMYFTRNVTPMEESLMVSSAEPTEESTTESMTELTPEVFSGSVRVELLNKGDICEGDNLEFKAIIDGNQALVSICWQKLTENKTTYQMEWLTVEKGEKFKILAVEANTAEKYRVVLYNADGEVCAEAAVKFPGFLHVPGGAIRENEHPATCTTEGSYDEVIYCTICGEELSRESKMIEKIAHTPGEAVRENEVAATSEKEGSYDEVVYCISCGAQLSRKEKSIALDPDNES